MIWKIIAYYFLQMILATCVLTMTAKWELTADNATDVAAKYAEMFNDGLVNLREYTSCKCEGVFAINCSSYLVCLAVNGGYIGAEGTCQPQQNFDPFTKQCSSSYDCQPSCTGPGFVCHKSTSFTLCAAAGVVVVKNQSCPTGYYCNQKCTSPCLNNISNC
jgi:hypothetical protein